MAVTDGSDHSASRRDVLVLWDISDADAGCDETPANCHIGASILVALSLLSDY